MDKAFVYILKYSDGSYYTGSTKELALRIEQHQAGFGANYTRKRLPVNLYIAKNLKELNRHLPERSKYRAGAGERKKR